MSSSVGPSGEYAGLERELEELGEAEEKTVDDSSESSEDDEEDAEEVRVSTRQTEALFGMSASQVFGGRHKPKRIRRGLTEGKLLPPQVAGPLADAYSAFADKDYARATAILSQCVISAPRLPDPYLTMALMHEERGNMRAATQLFVMVALNSSTSNTGIWREVLELSMGLGDAGQALMALNRLLKRRPTLDLYHTKVCVELAMDRSDNAAAKSMERLLVAFPAAEHLIVDFADRCRGFGWYDRAVASYIRYICLFTGSRGEPPILLKQFKYIPRATVQLGCSDEELARVMHCFRRASLILLDTGFSKHAQDALWLADLTCAYAEQVVQHRAMRNEPAPSLPADLPLLQAVARAKSRESSLMLLACRAVLPLLSADMAGADPAELFYLASLALRFAGELLDSNMLTQAGRVVQAVETNVSLAALSPVHRLVMLNRLGWLLSRLKQHDKAEQHFRDALLVHADSGAALLGLLECLPADRRAEPLRQAGTRLAGLLAALDAADPTAGYPTWESNLEAVAAARDRLPEFSLFSLEQLSHEYRLVLALAGGDGEASETFADVMLPALLSIGSSAAADNIRALRQSVSTKRQLTRLPQDLFVPLAVLGAKGATSARPSPIGRLVAGLVSFVRADRYLAHSEVVSAATRLLDYLKQRGDDIDATVTAKLEQLAGALVVAPKAVASEGRAGRGAPSHMETQQSEQSLLLEVVESAGATTGKRRRGKQFSRERAVVQARVHRSVELASKALVLAPQSILVANQLTRAFYLAASPLDQTALEEAVPVAGLACPDSLPLSLMRGHYKATRRRYLAALRLYSEVYWRAPSQPLPCLLLHALLLHMSLRYHAMGRHDVRPHPLSNVLGRRDKRTCRSLPRLSRS